MVAEDYYVVLDNYAEGLRMARIKGIYETLANAINHIQGPAIVISGSRGSDYIELWNAPLGEIRSNDLEKRVFVPRQKARDLGVHLFLEASQNPKGRINISDSSFSFPAIQAPYVSKAIIDVANCRNLPFNAKVIIEYNPRFN